MARLFEYQSKKLLKEIGISVPRGQTAKNPQEALKAAEKIGYPVVIKSQAWVTGRASLGGIRFAGNPQEAENAASQMLGKKLKNFIVEEILVEEKLAIKKEFYAGIIIDDSQKCPLLIFSSKGGSGIEEIAATYPQSVSRNPIRIREGLCERDAQKAAQEAGLEEGLIPLVSQVLVNLYKACRKYESRSLEINPLVITESQGIVAADCHMTIDDYAVFRHPETGIEIAREFDRPPSELERISYNVEKGDYRGTFYFIQMAADFSKDDNYIGFHGAGGGGSMMSMDAVLKEGFKIANFCDTSGNPPASKVYRAARIILSQPNLKAYFGSGSGVASQEQFHSARGLLKAFLEENLKIPAVIRLGGNQEERAIDILTSYTKGLSVPVECYGKDSPASFCAKRLKEIISKKYRKDTKKSIFARDKAKSPYSFETVTGGTITYDHSKCQECESKICVKNCIPQILKLDKDRPVLAISGEEARKGKCTECLVCELDCFFHGARGAKIDLPIPGLDEYRKKAKSSKGEKIDSSAG